MTNFLHKMAGKIAGTTGPQSSKSAVVEPAPGSTVGGTQPTAATTSSSTRSDSYAPNSPGGSQFQQDRTATSTSTGFADSSRPGGEERFKYDPSKSTTGSSSYDTNSSTGIPSTGSTSATSAAPTLSGRDTRSSYAAGSSTDSSSNRRTSTDAKIAEGVSSRSGGLTGGVDEQHFDAGTASTSSTSRGTSGSGTSAVHSIGDALKSGDRIEDIVKGDGKIERHEAAPIVREHVHDEYMHVNRTRIDEIHQKTHIIQIIQPIKDTVVEGMTRERVDEGTEVRHHNYEGVDKTEQQLAQAREEYIRSMTRPAESHDERHYETTEQPTINRMERVNVVEQVIPVFESELQASRSGQEFTADTTRSEYKPYNHQQQSSQQQQQQQREVVGVMPVVSAPADSTTTTTSSSTTSGTANPIGNTNNNDQYIR